MSRFLFWFVVFLTVGGLALHYKVDIPYVLSWVGKLPGDVVVRKHRTLFYLPILSSAISSLILTFLVHVFDSNNKS